MRVATVGAGPAGLFLGAALAASATGGYVSMLELPSCPDAVEPLPRAVQASGWRAPFAAGPTRAELRTIVAQAVGSTAT